MSSKFFVNLFIFFGVMLFWAFLNYVFKTTSDLTNSYVIAFFLVWNLNHCEKENET